MENKVTLTLIEQYKLKMVIDYEVGKVRAQRAAELLGITRRQFRRRMQFVFCVSTTYLYKTLT